MYRVGLVQNQSEMAHYSYADCRGLISSYGYRVVHFTGDDIGELLRQMSGDRLDAVVLASNALNDPSILKALCSPEFAGLLTGFLQRERGFLSFQQLGLGMRRGPAMSLLPEPYGRVRPVVRPPDESFEAGALKPPAGTRHFLLHYPNDLAMGSLLGGEDETALSGRYWHYWDDASLADWDVLLEDAGPAAPRSLVIASKESAQCRVVLSAIPMDWQRRSAGTENLLRYVVEGRHNTAVLLDPKHETVSCSYLMETLRTRRLGIGVYCLPEEGEALIRNLGHDVHSSVVVQPGVHDTLADDVRSAIDRAAAERRLRIFRFGEPEGHLRPVSIVSAELAPARLLGDIELSVHADLERGYVDDSFWGHVETLQTLVSMGRNVDYGPHLTEAWKIVANHDRNGSYDEVFGATVALWWMRAHYLGLSHPGTEESMRWLREALPGARDRDKAMAYFTFSLCTPLDPVWVSDLQASLAKLGSRMGRYNDSDKTVFLRAALAVGELSVLPALIVSLEESLDVEGKWVDLVTTAAVASALMHAHAALESEETLSLRVKIEAMCLKAMIYILDQLDADSLDERFLRYPWRGKASTSVLCLRAWLEFDELIEIPIFEVAESLARVKSRDDESVASRTGLSVLERLKEERDLAKTEAVDLRGRLEEKSSEVAEGEHKLLLARRYRFVLLATIYVFGWIIAGTWGPHGEQSVGQVLEQAFVLQWRVHLGLIGPLVGFFLLPWRRWAGLDDKTSASAKGVKPAR